MPVSRTDARTTIERHEGTARDDIAQHHRRVEIHRATPDNERSVHDQQVSRDTRIATEQQHETQQPGGSGGGKTLAKVIAMSRRFIRVLVLAVADELTLGGAPINTCLASRGADARSDIRAGRALPMPRSLARAPRSLA
jgi:hypothetical protein